MTTDYFVFLTHPGSTPIRKQSPVLTINFNKFETGFSKVFQLIMRSVYRNPTRPNNELLQPKNAVQKIIELCMR